MLEGQNRHGGGVDRAGAAVNTWIAVFVVIVVYELAGSVAARAIDCSRFGAWLDVKGIQLRDYLKGRHERCDDSGG